MPPLRLLILSCLLLWGGVPSVRAEGGITFFESKVRPLLVTRCLDCHGAEKQKDGLRLDSRAAWQAGGENGAALIPGDGERSRLIAAVRYRDQDLQMPPKQKLGDAEYRGPRVHGAHAGLRALSRPQIRPGHGPRFPEGGKQGGNLKAFLT